jgi:RNA polymerase sigma factor (sigma-70 family)
MAELIHQLRRTVLLRDGAGLTDGQLLEEYISRHDEAALAALVQRHAQMVWGVCRRVLGNYHDAEDAFQATFLVLVRKATSVRPREMIANWLYGVAHQTALKAKATASTRKGRERQVVEMPEPAVADAAQWDELLPVLDEELSRLPDKYRVVVVLCDLEGKTRKEVARQLGVPEGTVAGWVARARVMLGNRFAQRGITLSGGALATILSQNVASAGVPALVVSNIIKVASLIAAGQAAVPGLISVKVAALTEGVLKAMYVTTFKVVMAAVLVVGLVAGATGLSIMQTAAADGPVKVKPGVGPGFGFGGGGGATPISDQKADGPAKADGPVKVKPGVGPGFGFGGGGGATPISDQKADGPVKVKPGAGPGFGFGAGGGATPISDKKAVGPVKTKPGAGPGFGFGAGGGATPINP